MDLELRHLRAFTALAHHRSYTRAATELMVTQPALSRTIQQLEATLGIRLVDRSSRHVALTAAGQEFLFHARRVLGNLDQAARDMRVHRTLRLGFSWLLPDPWAQRTIARFERATDAEVTLARVDNPVATLETARIDIAVLRGHLELTGATVHPLFDEQRIAAISTSSFLATRKSIDWSEFHQWPLVVNTVTGTTNPGSWHPAAAPRTVVPCANYDEWLETVAADRGVGVVPALAARRAAHSGVRFIPLTNAPTIPVRLAHLPSGGRRPLLREFLHAATAPECTATTGTHADGPGNDNGVR
ncbi:LysR family transcriptional regulator [Streptomyces catenulae]|uniref:LysR family transcriptional regulator n=1 Tax=Streptomyces catenulae TaxID=66875 RepID=A0ABV2Z0D4_9ACTN|nr:LysR family transcriptional regulator [Streptomyces catenulae]